MVANNGARFSWRAECRDKRRYASKIEAKRRARVMETKMGDGHLTAYRCSWALDEPHWHIGHPPAPEAIALALARSRPEFSNVTN